MATTGEVFPTAAATAAEGNWADNDWTAPTAVFADGGTTANVTAASFDSPDQTFVLKATGFDFSSIPDSATINGVTARVNAFFRSGQGSGSLDLCQLLDTAGARVGTNQCATPVALTTTTSTVITEGGTSDTWGNALTPAWVKDADFGIALGVLATAANADVDIDYVTLEIEYTPGLDLTAVTGDPATFSGPLITVLLTVTASNGLATFGGGDASYAEGEESLDLSASGGVAIFSGPTISVILAATLSGGLATFGGGAVAGPPLSASGGVATFSGPSAVVELTLDEGSGVATFGGGTASSSGGTTLEPPVTEPSLGGSFDETPTGGTFNGAASGGTPDELIRGGVVEDGLRVGTVVEQLRGGTVRPVTRSGTVVEPVRGGVFDETSTGGEVL